MKNKLLSIALIGIIAFLASGWTVLNAPAPKTILFEIEYHDFIDYSETIDNSCAGEVIDWSGKIHRKAKVIVYDDGTLEVDGHYNNQGVKGVGQTTGKKYQWSSTANIKLEAFVGLPEHVVQHGNITTKGGLVSKTSRNMHMTINGNGEITHFFDEVTDECF